MRLLNGIKSLPTTEAYAQNLKATRVQMHVHAPIGDWQIRAWAKEHGIDAPIGDLLRAFDDARYMIPLSHP